MTTGRSLIGALILALVAAGPAACGGGSGGSAASPIDDGASPNLEYPGGLESYSPFTVRDGAGNLMALRWDYVVNDGQPLDVTIDGNSGKVTFEHPMTVTWDPSTFTRETTIPFGFSGTLPDLSGVLPDLPSIPIDITGTGTVQSSEKIGVENGVTRIESQSSSVSATARTLILFTAKLTSISTLAFDSPLEWYPDRDDLASLPVGTVHQPEADVSGTVTGTVKVEITGQPAQEAPINRNVSAPQRWEIVEILPTFEVRGETYEDVVVLDLETVVPDLSNPGQEEGSNASIRAWYARGVGMVKATGAFTIWESPVDVELASTNF